MSLFASRTRSHRGPSREVVGAGTYAQDARKREFAGLVADGMSLAAASRRMGISKTTSMVLWREIRGELGWQAV